MGSRVDVMKPREEFKARTIETLGIVFRRERKWRNGACILRAVR